MLTKPLVTAFCRNGVLFPRFVVATDANLDLCQRLIDIYREAAQAHTPAGELEDFLKPILNSAKNRRFALALKKLLDDRSEYSANSALDYPALRKEVLDAAAKILKGDGELPQEPTWQSLLLKECPENPLLLNGQLYGDLPENDCLQKFDDLTAEQLLNRYNTGLVQAILLSAREMKLTVGATDAQKLRRLCQYLRFFQLLAQVENADVPGTRLKCLKMTIDGPAGILDQGRRYGLQLATFFPAVCTLPTWELEAEIRWEEKDVMLKLDDSSHLQCPYHNFSAYLPDELQLFQKHFQTLDADWRLADDISFLKAGGREIVFPDFSFRNRHTRVAIQLELFHRWHPRGLKERLDWLQAHPQTPLVIAVERTLARNPDTAALLESSEYFQNFGFLYRDYPTVDKTLKALEKRCQALETLKKP